MSLIFGKSCERLGAPAEAIMSAVGALPRLSRVLKEILQAPAGWERAGLSLASHRSGFTCFRSEVLVPGGGVADCAEPSAEQENWCPSLPCSGVRSLSRWQCRRLGTAGTLRTARFAPGPRGEVPGCALTGTRHSRAAIASAGFSLLSRPRAGPDAHAHTDAGWDRRGHAGADSHGSTGTPTPTRTPRRRVRICAAPGVRRRRRRGARAELGRSAGLFLGALLRIVSVFQMLES